MKKLFTTEAVSKGHPDKVCDQISDYILDAVLSEDPNGRVACEVSATTGLVVVMGEITTSTYVDVKGLVREKLKKIGYNSEDNFGIDGNTCGVIVALDEQSPDIASGLAEEFGAGDQGMMFGYACNTGEEYNYMPKSYILANKLLLRLDELRSRNKGVSRRVKFGPDAKSQITMEIKEDGTEVIDTIVISTQHKDYTDLDIMRAFIINTVIHEVIPRELITNETKILINPAGSFVIGGPQGDTGLTGRKIIADTYGGYCYHGGGAFSGKDCTKVDRSGAYMARYIAKNVVYSGIADECVVQLSYAIGKAEPVSVFIDTMGTNKSALSDSMISDIVVKNLDLTPKGIIDLFDLTTPQFTDTASYGHFTNPEYSWEVINDDLVSIFKSFLM